MYKEEYKNVPVDMSYLESFLTSEVYPAKFITQLEQVYTEWLRLTLQHSDYEGINAKDVADTSFWVSDFIDQLKLSVGIRPSWRYIEEIKKAS